MFTVLPPIQYLHIFRRTKKELLWEFSRGGQAIAKQDTLVVLIPQERQ